MSQESQTVKEVFLQALEIRSPNARVTFLNNACRDDAGLRRRVEALIVAHERPESLLDDDPIGSVPTIDLPITEKPGDQIGSYKLREKIGEGGFGVVYVAEQTEPVRRKVALKIIKPGMDTREIIARFEAERQALAMMDHPNIARVLDAGTTRENPKSEARNPKQIQSTKSECQKCAGDEVSNIPDSNFEFVSDFEFRASSLSACRPYFVMELVKGIPITEFCDEQKLSTRERLELFIQVCRAVQHAHQKGIIHRDIKPSNVMVTLHDATPVPKVIDFGVAKALSSKLTEKTVYTAYGQLVGTPLYMSPEQAQLNAHDIDTRSDIYSLGVLLYELLTGTTPFDKETLQKSGFDEMRRIICEVDPPRPSARISHGEPSRVSDRVTDDGTQRLTPLDSPTRRRIDPPKLAQSLRGELDWIVMKALEKDRTRRYETANGLARDLERYLHDEPIHARPPSTAYRFRKFARRNKVTLVSASLVTAALVMGLVGTAWQAVRANARRDQAVEAKELADHRLQRAVKAEQDAQASRRKAEQRSDEVTRLLASSYVDRAQALCEQGEIGRGLLWFAHSLQTAPDEATDLRRVIRTNLAAWHSQLHRIRMVVQLDGEVQAVVISPDGSRLLTASSVGTVQLWETSTGEAMGEPLHLQAPAGGLAFSPDGSRFITGHVDGTAQLWDAASRQPIGEPLRHAPSGEAFQAKNQVETVAFNPDGSRLMTAGGRGRGRLVRLWDADTLQPVGEPFDRGRLWDVRYCRNVLRAMVVSGTQLQVWDVERGEPIGSPIKVGVVTAGAISSDGSIFATAENDGGRIKLWKTETGEQALDPIVHGGTVLALAFSPNGSRLLSGGNTRASMLWDVATGEAIGTPLRQLSTAAHVGYCSDGTRIVTGSDDGSVRVWDVAHDRSVGRPIQYSDRVITAAFSPDGLRILTESDGVLKLRDAATGDVIGKPYQHPREGRVISMRFSPDGWRVLIKDGFHSLRLWDIPAGISSDIPLSGSLTDVAFSPDGSRILAGFQQRIGLGGFAQLWDAATLQRLGAPFSRVERHIMRVAFSPDGARIVTGSLDGTTRRWDAATLEAIGEPAIHQSEVKALACSPDGKRMLIGLADGTVRLWDVALQVPAGVPLHHQNIVTSVAFSPDGSRFLSCSIDQTAQLWDTPTQKPIGPLLKHDAWWPSGSFSPDGAEFLVSGWRGTAQLWEAPPGPLQGDPQRLVLWTQVVTGLQMDENNGIRALDGPAWQERYQRLQELGGPPAVAPLPAPLPKVETDFSRAMDLALRGRVRAEKGQWEQATADCARAIELSDNSPTLRTQIALWWGKLAEDNLNAGRNETCETLSRQAIALVEKLVADFPDDVESRVKLQHHYDRLIRLFNNTGRPEDAAEAERHRAAVYKDVVGHISSEWTNRNVLAIQGDFPSEWQDRKNLAIRQVNRADGLRHLGRLQQAEKLFASAWLLSKTVIVEAYDQGELVIRGSDNPWVVGQCHLQLARIEAYTGQDREALDSFERALQLIRPYGFAYARFANFLLNSSDPDIRDPQRALTEATRAVQWEPDNAYCWGVLGQADYWTGDYAAAIDALEKSIAGVGGGFRSRADSFDSVTNAFFLAMAHARLGQEQEARRRYEQASAFAEKFAADEELHRLRAEAAELLGLRQENHKDTKNTKNEQAPP